MTLKLLVLRQMCLDKESLEAKQNQIINEINLAL